MSHPTTAPARRLGALVLITTVLAVLLGSLGMAPAYAVVGISSIAPNSGTTAGGDSIVITGSGFTGTTDVILGVSAASFTVDSDTQITATTPAGAAGAVDVLVSGVGGIDTAIGGFTYIAPATAPDAPTGLNATPGDTQVDLSWTAPASDGGSPITDYEVSYNIVGDTPGTPTSLSTVSTSATITGLTNGQQYEFKIRAVNAMGASAWTSYVTATPNAPAAPTLSTVSPASGPTGGGTVVTITGTGFTGATDVQFDAAVASFTVDSATQITATAPGHAAGLVALTVTTPAGSTTAPDAFEYVAPATAPGAPTGLNATPGDTTVDLSWTAPASDGGSAITDYVVAYNDGSGWATFADGTSVTTSATVTGLTNGTSYDFRVSAVNAIGTSAPSSTATATPTAAATVPTAPLHVTATAGNGQITVTWDAPASDGGSPITQYGINYDDFQPAIMVSAPGTSHTITGLTNGTTYTIGVYAENAVGNSTLSGTVTATPTAPQPDSSPAQDPAPQTVTVTWNANLASGCTFEYSVVPAGTMVNAPECSVSGYAFLGWDRAVPFIATSNTTVNGTWQHVPGVLTITDAKVLPGSIKFTYAYDDLTPADTFVVVDKDGALACSSTQGTADANTCTAVGAKPGTYYAFAKANGVEGPRTAFEAKATPTGFRPVGPVRYIVPSTSVVGGESMLVRVENAFPGCQAAYRLYNPGGIRKFTALRTVDADGTSRARVEFGSWRGVWKVQVVLSGAQCEAGDTFETTVQVRGH